MDRRTFLKRSALFAGGLTIVGPLQAYAQNIENGEPVADPGYGPLTDQGDLALPDGFSSRIVAREGDPMSDGSPTPSTFDGMAAFAGPGGTTILMRNHENRQSVSFPAPAYELPVVVPPAKQYDRLYQFNAGVVKSVIADDLRVVESFAVLGGTTTNCAGGMMPWGSWISCEEAHQDGSVPHGYMFEVPVDADGPVDPVPIRNAGRFLHEAVAWHDGFLYMTEDVDSAGIAVAFYRFRPERAPRRPGELARMEGTLEALMIVDQPAVRTNFGFPTGEPFDVEWVAIEDREPAEDTVSEEAHEKGAARFSREEGIWVGNGKVYFDCTDGGNAAMGQIWELDPEAQTIQLIYESPGEDELQGPDNLVVAPTGDLIICEDPFTTEPYIRGLTPEGRIYDFARSITNTTEFCGACFSPDGSTLFVNQRGQAALPYAQPPGVTYAIQGPFSSREGL